LRIKKLEICGFKSFKDRTVIHFDAGITGIVGPNGCGKSNIVDALVWVMGEMSAKHLRGASMEDVIFAGSQDYAPMGVAEVSLTLENDGGPFPVQYLNHSEVMVTRRLHRGGESEYLVNKEAARLRDIQEIFMDTGAGSRGFSIIEQGQIGKIITSKPSERRVLIEEAAGITKFKVRKKESERKLKATEQNLVRLADIVTELKRQLDSLQRQAEKAERYKKIKDEVTDKEMWLFSTQYKELRQKLEDVIAEFVEAQEKDAGFEGHYQSLQSNWEDLKTQLSEKQTEIEDHQIEFKKTSQTVVELEKSIREAQFEIEQAKRSKQMTGDFLGQYQARQQALASEIETIERNYLNAVEAAETAEYQFQESQKSFDEAMIKIKASEVELTEKRRRLILLEQSQVGVKTRKESLVDKEQDLREEKSRVELAQNDILEQKKNFEKRRNDIYKKLESEKQLQLDMSKDLDVLKENIKIQEAHKITQQAAYDKAKEELSKVSSLLFTLENLQKNMEGFGEGVKDLLKANKDLGLKTIADVVDVPQEFEGVFSSAVGVRIQSLVSPQLTQDKILPLIDELIANDKGKVSFLSNDGSSPSLSSKEISIEGVKTLFDVVTVNGAYEKTLKPFLSQIFIVKDYAQAQAILKDRVEALCVTAQGAVYDALGFITGGSVSGAEASLMQRKREIKELSEKKDKLEVEVNHLKKEFEDTLDSIQSMQQELESAKELTTNKEIILAGLKKDFEQSEYELKNVERAFEKQNASFKEINEKWEKMSQEMSALDQRQETEQAEIDQLNSDISELDQEYRLVSEGIEDLRQQSLDSKIAFTSQNEQKESIKTALDKLESSLQEVEGEIELMVSKAEASTSIMSENELLVEKQKIDLEKKILVSEEINKKVSGLKDQFEAIYVQEKEASEKVLKINLEKNQLLSKIKECSMQKEQIETKIDYLKQQSEEKYLQSLEEVFPKFVDLFAREDQSRIDGEVKELRSKLSKIGEVNISAIREYEDISGRYTFLSEQQDDLLKAKDQLRKVIDRINRICTRRFRDTFEAVNERFTKVFPVLFGGGEASLILVETEDDNEPGIDIISKPPGKKMQNVTLLSGGEKALTAVSLIFSIFLVKPSPFCLLDEVDAPLDDANVFRFNDLVKEMAKRSQIILVTHNKNTMAVNNKLYGVTMQEKGVSKMVSVDLDGQVKLTAANA
jgi:chromosome segregation protein